MRLVAGEASLLGRTVGVGEYAGRAATGPPVPIVSHSPTSDHQKYGMGYVKMDTQAAVKV